MVINSLFLQNTESSSPAMNGLGMQKTTGAGYLFSDIIKVQLGSEPTSDAGLSQSITGESEIFSPGDVKSLLALIKNLTGDSELSEELKSLLEENNLLMGETTVTEEELENILAQLLNQPDTVVFGFNQVSEEPVKLTSIEEIKNYLAENDEIFINAGDSSKSLKIDLKLLSGDGSQEKLIEGQSGNGDGEKKFQITYNFEKLEESGSQKKNNSETMQSFEELAKSVQKTDKKVLTGESNVKVVSEENAKTNSEQGKTNSVSENVSALNQEKQSKDSSSEIKVPFDNKAEQETTSEAKTKDSSKNELNNLVKDASKEAKVSADAKESNGKIVSDQKADKQNSDDKQKVNLKSESEVKQTSTEGNQKSEVSLTEENDSEFIDPKNVKQKSAKVKPEVNTKVTDDAAIKAEAKTKANAETVNAEVKKAVKSENVNVNGKPIVTNQEAKQEVKPELQNLSNNSQKSEIANSLRSDSESTNFKFSDESKSGSNNTKNSGTEFSSGTKFSDLISEKINKEQFLMKSDTNRIVKAAELVKEISKYIQSQDKNSLTLHIEPEHLGKVKIMMEVTDKIVKAHIEVDNEVAKHMVESNVKELQAQSQKNGVTITQVNISLSNAEQKNNKQFADKKKNNDEETQKLMDTELVDESEDRKVKNLGYNTVEYVA